MKDGSEYVKFVTQRVVRYIETPKDVRRQVRKEAKAVREPWLTRWFGVAPLGIKIWWNGKKDRRRVKDVKEQPADQLRIR
ncbi:YqzE family protein [Paenibacillus tarimensis]